MTPEFDSLWQEFLDGGLGADGFTRLDAMLRADPALARHAADLYEEHRLLGLALRVESAEGFVGATLARLQGEREAFADRTQARLRKTDEAERGAGGRPDRGAAEARGWRDPWVRAIGIAASLLLAATVGLLGWAASLGRPPATEAGAAHFATVLRMEDCQWHGNAGPRFEGERLPAGRLSLAQGSAVVRFDSGATLVLAGPAELDLESRGSAILHRGTVTVRAPAEAYGFTLRTPASDVVDLGTEFAVTVDSAGATEVQVLEGEVEYRRPRGREDTGTLLTGGQAVRFDSPTATGTRSGAVDAPRYAELINRLQSSPPPGRLVAYEGFEYAPGTLALAHADGGTGWSGPWRLRAGGEFNSRSDSRTDLAIAADSLQWPGAGPARGGAVEFAPGLNYRIRGLAQPIDLGKDGVYYVSFLLHQEADDGLAPGKNPRAATRVSLRSGTDYWGQAVGFTMRPSYEPQIGCGEGNTFSIPLKFPAGQTLLWVGKISAHARGEDEVFLKIYTAGESLDRFEPAAWTLASRGFFSDVRLDELVLTVAGSSRRWIDEIRIGTTWDAVVPDQALARARPESAHRKVSE